VGLIQRRPAIHHDTTKPAAVSDPARPERMTASTRWSRSRAVKRARRGTWGVASKNDSRSHAYFFSVPAVLGPQHLHRPGDRNIPQSLKTALFAPGRDDAAAWTARWLVGFDDDLPAAGSDGGGDDVVVGQVEEEGGSVGWEPG
jgi:hypothetical protein